jgi:TetR/AcrR family transcriptional regulator
MTFEVPAHGGKPTGRIRQQNEETILRAAEDEFARHGFKGTSMNTIALKAGLPKANLHYYFTNKLGLYVAVLSNIVELWDSTFNSLTAEDGAGVDPLHPRQDGVLQAPAPGIADFRHGSHQWRRMPE